MGLYREINAGLAKLQEQREATPLKGFLRAMEIRVKIIRALREANYWRAQAMR
jgi:hypothetical protein